MPARAEDRRRDASRAAIVIIQIGETKQQRRAAVPKPATAGPFRAANSTTDDRRARAVAVVNWATVPSEPMNAGLGRRTDQTDGIGTRRTKARHSD